MDPVNQNKPDDTSVENNSSNKMRKLMVEKVRRDRINHSIEELRTLLNRGEQSRGQTASKMEKADILEMAVSLLRQTRPSHSQKGFSPCLQETLRHLSLHAALQPAEREDIRRLYERTSVQRRRASGEQGRLTAAVKRATSRSSPRSQGSLWRPW